MLTINLFSLFSKSSLLNYLIDLAKYFIHESKFHNKNLNKRGFEAYSRSKCVLAKKDYSLRVLEIGLPLRYETINFSL